MRITIIHGQNHKGTTYHIARQIAEKTGGEITEFFLPRDFGSFCAGCNSCFNNSETACPHYEKLLPITKALDAADVIILESPVYVIHVTGAMKTFLDHLGYRFMIHRPQENMFSKQAVCVSTAAGAGMKSANKDMYDSLFLWGVGRIYQYGERVKSLTWNEVSDEMRRKIWRKTDAISKKLRCNYGKVKPGLKTIGFFSIARRLQLNGLSKTDIEYWKAKGWTENKRPWKHS